MERVIGLLDAMPYLRAYTGQVFVVKAGGELLADHRWLGGIARDLAVMHRLGIGVVWVHGGGPQLDAAADRLGIDNQTVAGRRVTSPELLEAAIMEWRGKLNVSCVAALQRHGERAVGLCGVDGGLLEANRRPPVRVDDDDGQTREVDYGRVGDLQRVRVDLVRATLGLPAIPVVTPLARGPEGEVLNVNADTVAAELSVGLRAAKLILLTRAPGILEDPDDASSVLHWTDLAELEQLEARGVIQGGMRPKVAAIHRTLRGGVPRVHVVDGRSVGALLEEIFTTEGSGTLVVEHADETPAEPTGGLNP